MLKRDYISVLQGSRVPFDTGVLCFKFYNFMSLAFVFFLVWHSSYYSATLILKSFINSFIHEQWRSQNPKKVMHIKGRLLDQAVILFTGMRTVSHSQSGKYVG